MTFDEDPFDVFTNGWMLFRPREELLKEENKLVGIFQVISEMEGVSVSITRIKTNLPPLNFAVVDLECNPPKMIGLFFFNTLYQLMVEDKSKLVHFNAILSKVLKRFMLTVLFSFSTYEARFIQKILPFQLQKQLPDKNFEFLTRLRVINLQRNSSESLVSALISIGEEPSDDPLLRENNNINEHYEQGHHELIMAHNKSCITSTLKIVKQRFLRTHLW